MKKRTVNSKYFIPVCYLLFFVLAFLVSFHLTFPVESLRQRIIYEIEKRTPLEVDIKSVDVSPIFSFKIHGVNFYRSKEPCMDIDDLNVSPSVLSLFSNKLELPFKSHLSGGEAEGSLMYNFKTKQVAGAKVRVGGINIERVLLISTANLGNKDSLIQGILSGNFSIELSPQTQGEFAFEVSKLGIRNIKLMGFLLPTFDNLQSSFKGRIENKVTRVEELKVKGDDIDLMLSGTMPLLWKISKGDRLDLKVRLQSTGAKLGIVKTFLAPRSDGSLGGKITGTLARPRVVTARD